MTVWKMHMWNQPRLLTKVSKLLSKVLFEGLRCHSVVEHLPVVPTVSEALGSILNTAGEFCWKNDSDPCFFIVKSLECNVSLFSWWPWRQAAGTQVFLRLAEWEQGLYKLNTSWQMTAVLELRQQRTGSANMCPLQKSLNSIYLRWIWYFCVT